MRDHLAKARHNEKFLKLINDSIKDDFFDWKITISFYSGLHYLKAFLKLKRVYGGNTHTQIDNLINPSSTTKKVDIPEDIYGKYQELLNNSRNARYEAYQSSKFQIMLLEIKKDQSTKLLIELKEYFRSQGLSI